MQNATYGTPQFAWQSLTYLSIGHWVEHVRQNNERVRSNLGQSYVGQ